MSAVDLLPCPFCGGTNITDESYWIASPVEWFGKFKCNDCVTDGPLSEFKYDDRAEAVADARAMWNRRAPVSAGKVKALESALRKLETANEALCGARPQRIYNAMICAGMSASMIELDEARREARDLLLSALQPGDGWQDGQRFKLGQRVQVSSRYEHAGEWRDQVLTIISVDLAPDGVTHSYTTADGVTKRGTWDCPADGWSEDDLSPAIPQGEEAK